MNDFSRDYLNLVSTKFKGLNLTRILDDKEFYLKQYLDSILPFKDVTTLKEIIKKNKVHVDIGFGGGFPILPLANEFKDISFIGFEARSKKSKAVNEIANDLKLGHVKTFHQRFENVYFDKDATITFKAVSTIENLIPKIITDKKLTVVFYKGPSFYELEDLDWLGPDWKIVEEKLLNIDGTEGRMVIVLENKNVLHGTMIQQFRKNKNKDLVSLSSFL